MESLRRDLVYAWRSLRRAPGFAAVAIVTLALGIGTNAVIFTIAAPMLVKPLPFPHSDRMVELLRTIHGQPQNNLTASEGIYLLAHPGALAPLAMTDGAASANLTAAGSVARRIITMQVTHDYFRVMGIEPAQGRDFTAADDQPGTTPAAVISYDLWQSQFGGSSAVLGQQVTLNGSLATVIGVMPRSFPSLTQNQLVSDPVQAWMALQPTEAALAPMGPNLDLLGRLRPGTSIAQAQAEINIEKAAFNRVYPRVAVHSDWGVESYQAQIAGDSQQPLLLLLGAVGLVLLIACANLANLLLARATARQREMSIRAALGANSGRIVRQLLTESVLLAALGALGGWLLAWWTLPLLRGSIPHDYALPLAGHLDPLALAFTAALAVVTGVLFGLAPAWHSSRANLTDGLKEGTGAGSSRASGRTRNMLVVGEVALAFVLLASAALLLASLLHLRGLDPGFQLDGVMTAQTSLNGARAATDAATARYTQQVVDQLERIPGVSAAASITGVPLTRAMNYPLIIAGRKEDGYSDDVEWRAISPDYFKTLSIPIVIGRAFTAGDTAASPKVAIISRVAAEHYWPGRSPIGQVIGVPDPAGHGQETQFQVVGVTADVHENGVDQDAPPSFYIPQMQASDAINALENHWFPMGFVIRGQGPALGTDIRQAFLVVDATQPAFHVLSLEALKGNSLGQYRFLSLLLGIFAALALGLGAVGLYGVMSYSVAQRTREIGIRMALGASAGDVRRQFASRGLALTALGLAIGLIAALWLTRLLTGFLFGVTPTNPLVLAATAIVLLALGWLASLIPAARAARTDPLAALRQ